MSRALIKAKQMIDALTFKMPISQQDFIDAVVNDVISEMKAAVRASFPDGAPQETIDRAIQQIDEQKPKMQYGDHMVHALLEQTYSKIEVILNRLFDGMKDVIKRAFEEYDTNLSVRTSGSTAATGTCDSNTCAVDIDITTQGGPV